MSAELGWDEVAARGGGRGQTESIYRCAILPPDQFFAATAGPPLRPFACATLRVPLPRERLQLNHPGRSNKRILMFRASELFRASEDACPTVFLLTLRLPSARDALAGGATEARQEEDVIAGPAGPAAKCWTSVT